MTKCDFCTESSPSGKCFWTSPACREDYCKKAIALMVKALSSEQTDKQNNKRKHFKK